ncbi:MAG: hypothetical protein U5K56_10200 [Halioglobus sp.]|nr:hypothetical protein [Halioglobus sp.]
MHLLFQLATSWWKDPMFFSMYSSAMDQFAGGRRGRVLLHHYYAEIDGEVVHVRGNGVVMMLTLAPVAGVGISIKIDIYEILIY